MSDDANDEPRHEAGFEEGRVSGQRATTRAISRHLFE